MRVIDPGHVYELENYRAEEAVSQGLERQRISFVKRRVPADPGRVDLRDGTNCQELLKVLINRVLFLDQEARHPMNRVLLLCLRRALVLFETRALERKVEKHTLLPETLDYSSHDGHLTLVARHGRYLIDG